ncbi:uncharacterized protein N0V89_005709 [Didymosphaeria variabile]|uniref:Uncharacterized protein n=1 Tax=Didymosphaeria variabile TaxID=1932322 RepID=A0A9W9CBG4_9PLEO|nr:uncharacterized protein N0V89_005709 [Didymosphaeria variabile]KAJ4353977.1 hypothetical protein N0V89_005709 [Didymosphaeria variabile]
MATISKPTCACNPFEACHCGSWSYQFTDTPTMSIFTTFDELPVDDEGWVPVSAGASVQKPLNISDPEKSSCDEHENAQFDQRIAEQLTECNNTPNQQHVQTIDPFGLTSTFGMGTQQFSNSMGFEGGIGQCDFSQERSDFDNAMGLSSNHFSFDNFGDDDFRDSSMPPINTTAINPAQSMPFNGARYHDAVLGTILSPGLAEFLNATSTSLDQPQNQVAFPGHGIDNASIGRVAPRDHSTSLSIDQPQMRTPQKAHAALNDAWSQKTQCTKNQTFAEDQAFAQARAFAQANVRTVQEAGQDLFGIYTQNQRSRQGPSNQATSVLPTPTSTKNLSANQLGKQPVPQPSSSPAGRTPSKKRPRPADIQIPSEASKRARIDAPGPPPFAAEVKSNAARGRAVKVLFKTPWEQMTQMEKARILLPMMIGKHPVEFEKEEMQRGLSYGAMRQREALEKTMHLSNEAAAETESSAAPRKTLALAEMDEDDEEAVLKARLAEIEANKKAKVAEEKRRISNEKRAATTRRKRQEKKEADRLKREKELEEIARQKELEAHREASFAGERPQAAQEQGMPEQMREAYAHVGFAPAQPYMG